MLEKSDLIHIFEGSEITVNLLKAELEANGIPAVVRNDFKSGITSGFVGGTPSSIDLFIQETDLEKAEPIIAVFKDTSPNP